jgi:hypothetical protein
MPWRGERGFDAGEFSVPCAMSLSAQGDVLVCDKEHNCVAVFGPDGKFLRTLPAAHDQQNIKLNKVYNALQSADGNILVADNDCVMIAAVQQ